DRSRAMVCDGNRVRRCHHSGHCEIAMILIWLIAIAMIGGVLAWLTARKSETACRWISLLSMVLDLALALFIWAGHFPHATITRGDSWLINFDVPWIAYLGIHFHLAIDGLSLILVVLTAFLGIMSVGTSWTEIRHRVGFFHFNLLWVLSGIIGVFLAMDLFLFYSFWEMMLVPMYFLIAIWGHERRVYASTKFFLFTQLSGLLMLAAILGLAILHQRATGLWSFDYQALLGLAIVPSTATWLMLGFVVAFAVKLQAFPVHTWLPDAHTEAPTAGSLILAGLLQKTGDYGFIRFVLPIYPDAARQLAP